MGLDKDIENQIQSLTTMNTKINLILENINLEETEPEDDNQKINEQYTALIHNNNEC